MKNFCNYSLLRLLTVLLIFSAAGCSKSHVVSGSVLFSDGSPLGTGKVVFENAGQSYTGRIHEDGTFSLGQLKDGEGIPSGRYQVYIAEAWRYEPVPDGLPNRIELIDVKYRRKQTSGLEYEISQKQTVLVITVEKPKPKGKPH